MSELREHSLRIGTRRVRYLSGGSGPALLLCHGFMGSAENFAQWFDALTPRRRLVVPDLPGCGASAPLDGPHTAANLAGALLPLLDELGVERLDLGGLCLGVPVALALLRRRPQAVDRLVLHTPLLSPWLVRRSFHLQVRLLTAPVVHPAAAWLKDRRLVSDLYKRLMVEGDNVDRAAAEVNFRNQLRADPRCTREWLRDGLRCQDAGLLASRRAPSLLLAAAGDRIVEVDRLRALVADCPSVQLDVDAEAGHGWTAASVRRQLGVITAFLDATPSALMGSPAA
ncbi:MAG TPA: alpha/beta fold hydrolase [Candidatus Dormibacteraeota bacterium]